MTLSYKPKTEQQLREEGLLADGAYDFEIVSATNGKSSKGNNMLTLKLRLFNPSGGAATIYDYIVYDTNLGEKKLRDVCMTCGLVKEYDKGVTEDDFAARSGKVFIGKQSSEQYGSKNVVKYYVVEKTPEPLDDEIPFA